MKTPSLLQRTTRLHQMQKLEGLGSGFGPARYRSPRAILSLFLLLFLFKSPASYAYANDTLTQSQKLSVRQTITSRGEIFYLGFFSPGNSSNQYLGIWHKNTHDRKVVWVANRKNPIPATDTEASLVIGKDGNLRLLDGKSTLIWQTNSTFPSNIITVAILSDNGDFTLQDNTSGLVLWESFNYPCDTLLPGMNIGQNAETGEKISLSSWKSNDDPSPGEFVAGLTTDRPPQSFVWNGSKPYWRGGPWDGGKFIGILDSSDGYASNFKLLPNNYLTLIPYSATLAVFMSLTPAGSLQIMQQDNVTDDLYISWLAPRNPCDIYGVCGPFGVCNKNKSIICECLKGFEPKYIDEWNKGNWGGGCFRRSELLCQRNLRSTTPVKAKADGFWKLSGVKLPDHFQLFPVPEKCQQWCIDNCSCLAYAFLERIGCMVWLGDLSDIQEFSYNGNDLFLRLAHSELDKDERKEKIIISVAAFSAVILLAVLLYSLHRSGATKRALAWIRNRKKGLSEADSMASSTDTSIEINRFADQRGHENSSELPLLALDKILVATDHFNIANKLGEGGFGEVYKGKLEDGQEVAVKRLSAHSGQGDDEFKNELILISKLRHRNLVRLLGCCTEGREKLLVYEYMRNKSLDTFLFDAKKRMQLDWAKRSNIIHGTARGLLYLHRDSRLRVIHRDLKASNILLDDNFEAKISDFGLARIFQGTQDLANTHRVVGTFGYMSPEYAIGGLFSEKSDVFSFGVLLLEIVSGMKNTSFFNQEKYIHLPGYAWDLWEEKKELHLLDQALADSYTPQDVQRCVQIGLLCLQDNAADRPTMSTVVVMLSSETELPMPKKPTFTFQSLRDSDLHSQPINIYSKNELSMSTLVGR